MTGDEESVRMDYDRFESVLFLSVAIGPDSLQNAENLVLVV